MKPCSRLFSRATGARAVSHSASGRGGRRAERLLQVCLQPSRMLRRQLVGSAWTRARRDGNPTHGASTRLRFCNKVCLACAGDAQSSRDDAGSLGSTSKADLVAKNLCSVVHSRRLCRAALASTTRRRRLSMRAHPRRRRFQAPCGGGQVTGIGCDTGESSSGTELPYRSFQRPTEYGLSAQSLY